MRKISAEELHKILQEHKKWRMGDGGKCADLRNAYLSGAYLSGADLSGAYLRDTSLYQVGGCGSAKRITTYDTLNDQVICGCWRDGKGNHLESFKERIEAIYGEKGKQPNAQYYADYQAAIKFFEALKEVHNANR